MEKNVRLAHSGARRDQDDDDAVLRVSILTERLRKNSGIERIMTAGGTQSKKEVNGVECNR
jgi:hypothetical protein